MVEQKLGPNGALIAAMELLSKRVNLLVEAIKRDAQWEDYYYIFDVPGQVELVTIYSTLEEIIQHLHQSCYFRVPLILRLSCLSYALLVCNCKFGGLDVLPGGKQLYCCVDFLTQEHVAL